MRPWCYARSLLGRFVKYGLLRVLHDIIYPGIYIYIYMCDFAVTPVGIHQAYSFLRAVVFFVGTRDSSQQKDLDFFFQLRRDLLLLFFFSSLGRGADVRDGHKTVFD